MQILRPVRQVPQFLCSVRNPAQADQRNIEMLGRAQMGEGFHVHHVLGDAFIGAAADDIAAGRKAGLGQAGDAQGQVETGAGK